MDSFYRNILYWIILVSIFTKLHGQATHETKSRQAEKRYETTTTSSPHNTPPISMAENYIRSRDIPKNITAQEISNIAKTLLYRTNYSNQALKNNLNIIESLMTVTNLRTAQVAYNSTDEILDSFDANVLIAAQEEIFNLEVTESIIVQTFNIAKTNIAGILVLKNANAFESRVLYRNDTIKEISAYQQLEIAAFLPDALIKQIEGSINANVAITIFLKDSLFVDTTNQRPTTQKLFSVQIPGLKNKPFNAPIRLVYKIHDGDRTAKSCAHWLYGANIKGAWALDQTSDTCGTIEVCDYYHVTHFGLLVLDKIDDIKQHQEALEIITVVGCCFSIVGICGILLTGILFKKWRDNKGNIILLHYTLATLLQICLLYISDYVDKKTVCDKTGCIITGLLLHYVVLAQFSWMLVISYLQYKRYVQIVGAPTTRVVLKSCLLGWGTPLPIILVLGICFKDSYGRNAVGLCYPSGAVFYVGLIVPIAFIILVNLGVLALILTSIFWKSSVPRLADNITVLKLRLILLLFFQLGITWIFGLMGGLSVVFVYLFCLTATLQGFVVFLLFIVFNEGANLYYLQLFGFKTKWSPTTTYASSSAGATAVSYTR